MAYLDKVIWAKDQQRSGSCLPWILPKLLEWWPCGKWPQLVCLICLVKFKSPRLIHSIKTAQYPVISVSSNLFLHRVSQIHACMSIILYQPCMLTKLMVNQWTWRERPIPIFCPDFGQCWHKYCSNVLSTANEIDANKFYHFNSNEIKEQNHFL